ncbi:phage tail sheath protein [Methylobacterium planeticum]|uniref:Phage tail protein n=1 Tax=Methylobacterium planeticum TaxID=2615211 RepID=A0A6N6MER6_9HYPH|nr:phage tail protein [Methylobacterium planeticum]KAB1069267.1 phage tail protein [Methylobacterium planeticum]
MATAPVFGTIDQRFSDEPLALGPVNFSKIAVVSTSTGADATLFPAGVSSDPTSYKAVRFSSGDTAFTSKLGTGYLADAVAAVNAQIAAGSQAADITVIRCAESVLTDAAAKLAATQANIIAGLQALKAAPAKINATPRLVGVPGYTAQRVGSTANPVIAALPEVLAALLAIAVVDVDDSSSANAIDSREDIGSERIMPVGVAARVFDTDGIAVITRPMAPRILGLITANDFRNGGKPFEPFANRQIYGLVGTSRDIPFDLRDGSVDGQQMLAAEVSIVVRGETDIDGAIADGGFVFIGTDNCATDGDVWQQIHQVRGADCIDVEHMRLTRQFLGRKVSASNAEAWINSLKFNLRDHKAASDILGYKTEFKPDQNSAEQVRLGRLTVDLGIEEAPVFRVAKRNVRRYRQAVVDLVADIAARINASAIL